MFAAGRRGRRLLSRTLAAVGWLSSKTAAAQRHESRHQANRDCREHHGGRLWHGDRDTDRIKRSAAGDEIGGLQLACYVEFADVVLAPGYKQMPAKFCDAQYVIANNQGRVCRGACRRVLANS